MSRLWIYRIAVVVLAVGLAAALLVWERYLPASMTGVMWESTLHMSVRSCRS